MGPVEYDRSGNGAPNVEITALADVFEDRMETSIRTTRALRPELSSRFKVEPDHRFVGFDAYKKLINSGDTWIVEE